MCSIFSPLHGAILAPSDIPSCPDSKVSLSPLQPIRSIGKTQGEHKVNKRGVHVRSETKWGTSDHIHTDPQKRLEGLKKQD